MSARLLIHFQKLCVIVARRPQVGCCLLTASTMCMNFIRREPRSLHYWLACPQQHYFSGEISHIEGHRKNSNETKIKLHDLKKLCMPQHFSYFLHFLAVEAARLRGTGRLFRMRIFFIPRFYFHPLRSFNTRKDVIDYIEAIFRVDNERRLI